MLDDPLARTQAEPEIEVLETARPQESDQQEARGESEEPGRARRCEGRRRAPAARHHRTTANLPVRTSPSTLRRTK